MASKKGVTCLLRRGALGLRECAGMKKALADVMVNDRKKGLVPVQVYNNATRELYMLGITYKSKATDPGIMLNQCPWCGASLRANMDKEAEEFADECG